MRYFRRVSITLALLSPLPLGGCGLYDWANANMPVIGDRCENWQCFTQSGQEQSHLNQQERLRPAANPTPDFTPTPAAGPSTPLAPPVGPEGAYQYVPRAPAAPGASSSDTQMPQ